MWHHCWKAGNVQAYFPNTNQFIPILKLCFPNLKKKQNVFQISHCIIPKQNGCSDTCTTEQEFEIFETIDKLDLITLGWIHVNNNTIQHLYLEKNLCR